MTHHRNMEQMLSAISDEETLEAQLEDVQEAEIDTPEERRLAGLLNEVMRREVKAEGEEAHEDSGTV